MTELYFSVDDHDWEEAGVDDPLDVRLITTVRINGVPHHLEAHQVKMDSDHVQRAVSPSAEEDLENVYLGVGGDGPWQTVTIRGKEYVLILTPFC